MCDETGQRRFKDDRNCHVCEKVNEERERPIVDDGLSFIGANFDIERTLE